VEVEFELTEDDLVAFNLFQCAMKRRMAREEARHNKAKGWIAASVVSILGVGLGAVLIIWPDLRGDVLEFVFTLALAFALLAVLGAWVSRPENLVRRFLNQGRNVRVLQRRKVAISPTGVRSVSTDFDAHYSWPGIDWIEATDDHAFFFLNTETAVIVPQEAFPRDEEFREFVAQARRWHDAAALEPLSEFRTKPASEKIEKE
jgi:hypothetical protein